MCIRDSGIPADIVPNGVQRAARKPKPAFGCAAELERADPTQLAVLIAVDDCEDALSRNRTSQIAGLLNRIPR
eukprot:14765145-Alexandrium_andersonii.AAC.1